uniref:Ig-like domain-containing protein n=1 Tax=Cyanoderma ruficeps TaxID=181631 RepID=A0A8C3RF46_9PASS
MGPHFKAVNGAEITQTPSLVVREDEKVTLKCSQNNNHNSMYWYLQQGGKGMQLIYYSYGPNQKEEGDIPAGFQANRPNVAEFYLDISSVKLNHSAIYFCASSLDTTLQSHLFSLHKPLPFQLIAELLCPDQPFILHLIRTINKDG